MATSLTVTRIAHACADLQLPGFRRLVILATMTTWPR